jgi:hypothetical protein
VGVSKGFPKEVIVCVDSTLCGSVARPWMSVSLQGGESIDPCVPYFIHTILMDDVSQCLEFSIPCDYGANGGE